ncbi:MAG: homoserine dehydrogenase, partial [Nitrospirae bacterium]|nr:homoserine dehydrogenase [Nitrospirota bacterium]
SKKSLLPSSQTSFVTDYKKVVDDPGVDIVIELIGGIEPAKTILLSALKKNKHVVTANKALLAEHGEELYNKANKMGLDIGFEGSVAGGIPIIRILKEGLAANQIESFYGIINGTSNYILTKMTEEKLPFESVLREAQRLGYAEADPTFDIEGIDTAHKLSILITLAFGTQVHFKDIYIEGITQITPLDIEYAREFGFKIKLLAIAKRRGNEIEARVHPTMIHEGEMLASVNGVFNAIYLVGNALGQTLFYGKGAGELPTGSAVVSDLIDIARNILYASSFEPQAPRVRVPLVSFLPQERKDLRIKPIDEIESLYYIRFMVLDNPGVLSHISGILGEHQISISAVIQKGRLAGETVPVVMMTHRSLERNVRQALETIDQLPYVSEKTLTIRVEGEET